MSDARRFIAIAMLLGLGGLLPAALGGVPERPVPGRPYPELWLAQANDSLGICGEDDRRTAAINAGLRHRRWLGFLDYAILTDLEESSRRSDEVTASIGLLLLERQGLLDGHDRLDLAVGAGLRWSGDYGGQELQNGFHDLIGQEDTVLPYEDAEPEGVLWCSGEWTIFAPAQGPWRGGLALALRALASSGGSARWSPEAALFLQHDAWGDIWISLRHEANGGDAPTRSKEAVLAAEDGTWIGYGVRLLGLPYFRAGYNPETEESYGTIGLTWTWR